MKKFLYYLLNFILFIFISNMLVVFNNPIYYLLAVLFIIIILYFIAYILPKTLKKKEINQNSKIYNIIKFAKTFIKIFLFFIFFMMISFIYAFFHLNFSNFYKKCKEVKIGMPKEEVEEIMNSFIKNNNFSTSYDGWYWTDLTEYNPNRIVQKKLIEENGIFISENSSGNYCNIIFDNKGKVKDVALFFE